LLLCSWAGHRRAAEAFTIIVSALNEQPDRLLYSPCPISFL
jgi:hypothetical protein